MGELAKIGIVNGKRLLLGPRPIDFPIADYDFSLRTLRECGLLNVGEKIVNGVSLSIEEIERLLGGVTLAALMQLVKLCGGARDLPEPIPLVVLPISSLLAGSDKHIAVETLTTYLRGISYKELRVVIDRFDHTSLDAGLLEAIAEIAACRSGLKIVGPPAEEIFSACNDEMLAGAGASKSIPLDWGSNAYGELESLLVKLRSAGVERLRPSCQPKALALTSKLGIPTSLVTDLDQFSSNKELAIELLEIDAFTSTGSKIDVWIPGILSITQKTRQKNGIEDARLLRSLAVGTLVLKNISTRRATSRYFSLGGIELAPCFGANDLGFGAVDQVTSEALSLEPYEVLKGLFHRFNCYG